MDDSHATKKKIKIHPAVEILNNLSSAVAEAADRKVQAKTKELAERKEIAAAEVKLKKRELAMNKKK
jgi:hypothetical protein